MSGHTVLHEPMLRVTGCPDDYVGLTAVCLGRVLVREDELNRIVDDSKQHADQPFADAGAAIERILAAGALRRDICLLLRYAAYVFDTLYEIERAGVDCKDLIGLHEYLLSADPRGMEGRPGSADAVTGKSR